MAKNEAKIKFTAETGEFNDAIKKSNNEMSELRAELKHAEAQMQNTGDSVAFLKKKHDLLEAQLKASQSKTEALNAKLEKAKQIFGENSDEAHKLKVQLKNAETAEEKLKKEIDDCTKELKDHAKTSKEAKKALKEMGESARNSEEGFTVAKGAIADLASESIQMAIGKVKEFIDYLMELPEATREIRQDMATLDTSFSKQGFSTEAATNTWKELYKVFGEDDRAVEAANLISKMSKNQEDLNEWVTITKGVWGEYQDSLPVEGLAEASNETAKTGKVTGVLADALNWSGEAAGMFSKYMSDDVTTAEDAFNEALAECNTEAERQALITETLTALYGDSAKAYEEASGAQIEAKDAAAENILIQNQMADAIEPVTTAWQGMKNELAVGFLPIIQSVAGFLSEHPGLLKAIAVTLTILAVAVGALAIAWGVYSVAQWIANAALLACPITWIVLAIVALIAVIVVIVAYWDELKAAAVGCWKGIKNAFSNVGSWFREKFSSAKDGVKNAWSSVTNFFSNIKDKIVNGFSNIKEKLSAPFKAAIDKIKGFFNNLKLKFPKIKMPHFSIKGEFSLNPPSVPKLGIDWYAKGGIFTKPTIFGTPYGFKGVGEAGAEAVLPIDRLQGYIAGAIERSSQVVNLQSLADSIEDLANRPIAMNINGKQFAMATAGDTDSVSGMRSRFVDRGMILD